jgi:hypothetical protein
MGEYVIDDKWRVVSRPEGVSPSGPGAWSAYLDVYAAADAARVQRLHSVCIQFDGTAASFRAELLRKVGKFERPEQAVASAAVEQVLAALASR